jgi:23S rRNA C2498 (ribose-2'-O)-methylase RlmM
MKFEHNLQKLEMSKPVFNKFQIKYVAFADHRFAKEVKKELNAAFPEEELTINKNSRDQWLFIGTLFSNKEIIDFNNYNLPFVDTILPIAKLINKSDQSFKNIISELNILFSQYQKKTFKIEVKKFDFKSDKSAKDIEVILGTELEKYNHLPDLLNPKIIVFLILTENESIISIIDAEKNNNVIDYFRASNKKHLNVINRAEYKIKEAVEFFNIDLSKIKNTLDIGAAPGGWTHFLSNNNIKVVAVDKGYLDYEKFNNKNKIIILENKEDIQANSNKINSFKFKNIDIKSINEKYDQNKYDIIHIKENLRNKEILQQFGRFDMLCIDINTTSDISSEIAISLAKFLNPKSYLIMTIKFNDLAVAKHILLAEHNLLQEYNDIKIKKMHHNREEITLYARLK